MSTFKIHVFTALMLAALSSQLSAAEIDRVEGRVTSVNNSHAEIQLASGSSVKTGDVVAVYRYRTGASKGTRPTRLVKIGEVRIEAVSTDRRAQAAITAGAVWRRDRLIARPYAN